MIPSLHNPLPTNAPICNELAEFGGIQFRSCHDSSKHRFPHTGTAFPLSHDRLPILSATKMATNGGMSKPTSTFAAASPFNSTATERADYLHLVTAIAIDSPMLVPDRRCFNLIRPRQRSCSLHQSARCILKSQVRKAAKYLVKSAFSVGTSGADDIRRGNGNESANYGCHAAHVRDQDA